MTAGRLLKPAEPTGARGPFVGGHEELGVAGVEDFGIESEPTLEPNSFSWNSAIEGKAPLKVKDQELRSLLRRNSRNIPW